MNQIKTPERLFSPVPNWFAVCGLWFVVNPLKSICAQQNGADEHKHGAHHEHIKLQGKVHDCDSLVRVRRAEASSMERSRNGTRRYDALQPQLSAMHAKDAGSEAPDRAIEKFFVSCSLHCNSGGGQ
jgi:hypothetical protein